MLGLLLAAGLVPSAFAGEIGRAPLNPAFVEYMEEAAAASELKTDGVKENALGWKPSPVDLSHLRDEPVVLTKGAKTFAASFDLRTEGKLTSVKNQNPYGTCWAHATYASMESALLPGETNDFSENHLVNLHGFDWGFDDGGNGFVSMAYLTRWEGPVNEADDPYPDEGGSTGAEPVRRHVQEVLLIPAKSGPTNNDAIKQALQDYGAVYVNYYHHDSYYHSTNASYYYAGGSNGNHAVAIVGWNDNYPSNQFNSVAPGNGAYIVKNSWGTGWGESGYFYVSYHDTVFAYDELFVFHDAGSTSNYSRVYDYDPLGWVNSIGTGSGTTFWGANLFTAEADEDLAAVGFYAVSADTDYEIYIYKGITAGAPRSGMLAASESGTGLAAGYGTIALSTNVGLTNGQRFSIVLKLTTPDTTYPQAFEYALAGYSSAAGASAGQSYYSSSGSSWTDLTTFESTANLCIKGYAASAEAPPSAPASIWASATNAAGFTAAWSGVAEAESYRLDVATDSGFTGGGGAGRMLLASNAATSPSLIAGDWSGTDLGGTTYVIMTQATSEVESPAFSTVGFTNLTVDFRARTYGGTTKSNITISISTNNGSTWSVAGVVNPLSGSTWSTIPTLTNTVDLGHAETRVRWQTLDAGAGVGVGVSNLVVRGWSMGSAGSYVAGYSNRTVSGTSESVTGLVEATAYYFRVRAVNGGGTSPNSPTGSVTTGVDEPGTPPVVDPIPRLLAAAGGELEYTVTATETNGDAVTFACTSAVDEATWAVDTNGYFLFYPTTNEIGAALFAFTATDKDGESSPVAMTVTVNSVAATNAFEEWLEGQWQDPGDTNFQEEADYDADGATTFEEYVADTDPAASNAVLVLEGERVDGSGSGAIRLAFPSSTGRYYQLVYATSLFSSATVSNLGPGVGGTMVWTNETVGTWYGGIRAWLTEPPE